MGSRLARALRPPLLAALLLAGPGAAAAQAAVTVAPAAAEEGGPVTFVLRTDAPLGESVTVTTAGGTATAGTDYSGRDGQPVVVRAGAAGTEVAIPTTGDDAVEADETFELIVDPVAPGATVRAVGTIRNDDPPPLVLVVRDAREGAASQTISVGLVVPSSRPVSVTVATADGTARAGSDFTPVARTLTFAPGQQIEDVGVPLLDDGVFEGDQTFEARLSGASGATIAVGTATGTITDDERVPLVTLEPAGPVAEGNAGQTTPIGVRVRLSGPAEAAAGVAVASERGTAASPSDFTALAQILVFPPGETTRDVAVLVRGDDDLEPDERLRVLAVGLGNATTADGAPAAATLTIRNDDRDLVAPRHTVGAPRLRGTLLSALVSCPVGEDVCGGRVTFFKDADRGHRVRSVRAERRLGAVEFRLAAGRRRTVRLRLSRAGVALLRRAGRPRVTAYALAADASGNRAVVRRSARLRVR